MQTIKALSFTKTVNKWLADTRQPRILHVFDNACNLINEHGDVLSIVIQQIGNGPFNLVIDGILFSEHLRIESQISISSAQLYLGDLTINAVNAKLWSPRPNWEVLYARREDVIRQAQGIAYPSGTVSSQTALLAMAESQLQISNYQLHNSPISNSLASSLAFADSPLARTITPQLVGLGQGLTPAGDDFIMGAVLAAWIIHPPDIASMLAKEIANIAAPLTTSLSAAWLRATGRGEAGQVWHDLFDALISADKMAVEESIEKILDVGHTSGADALAGFLGVFNSYAEQK